MNETGSPQIFISHAHQDRQVAASVCDALEREGLGCWIAPRNIAPGTRWAEAIIKGLKQCRVFLLIFSGHTNTSHQVHREVERAAGRGMPLYIVRIEDVPPSEKLELFLYAEHWQDAAGGDLAGRLPELAQNIKNLLAERKDEGPGPDDPESHGSSAPRARRRLRRTLLAIAGGVALIAAVYLGINALTRGRAPDGSTPPQGTEQAALVKADSTARRAGEDKPEPTTTPVTSPAAPRAAGGAAGAGTATITSTPPGALVLVDGRSYGRTPLRDRPLSAGAHRVDLVLAGYETARRDLQVPADRPALLDVELTPSAGKLMVESDPDSAQVLLDGERLGLTPHEFTGVSAGRHQVRVTLAGYAPGEDSVTVDPTRANRISLLLKSLAAKVTIRVVPSGEIYINGDRKSGETNVPYVAHLQQGTYDVLVKHPYWGEWPRRLVVDGTRDQELRFDFNQQLELTVTSEPPDARILVDGAFAGRVTPGRLLLRPGRRRIEVVKEGYHSSEGAKELTLETARSEPLHFKLIKID